MPYLNSRCILLLLIIALICISGFQVCSAQINMQNYRSFSSNPWVVAGSVSSGIPIPVAQSICPYSDLGITQMNYQSYTNVGGEFTFTITVTNSGTVASEESSIQVTFPGFESWIITETVPPLQPGETVEITVTITIPSTVSIGNGPFSVNLNPGNQNQECSQSNNSSMGLLLILPPGMTLELYKQMTNGQQFYKITDLFRDLSPPPAPEDTS